MNTKLSILLITAATTIFTATAFAEEGQAEGEKKQIQKRERKGEGKGQHERMSPEKHAELIKKFDKDGDGKLSEDERKAAREEGIKRHKEGKGAGEGEDKGKQKGKGKGRGKAAE